MKNRILILLIGSVFIALLAGCETVKGAGQDIENTGENIESAVEKNI